MIFMVNDMFPPEALIPSILILWVLSAFLFMRAAKYLKVQNVNFIKSLLNITVIFFLNILVIYLITNSSNRILHLLKLEKLSYFIGAAIGVIPTRFILKTDWKKAILLLLITVIIVPILLFIYYFLLIGFLMLYQFIGSLIIK